MRLTWRACLIRVFAIWIVVWPLVTLGLLALRTGVPDLPLAVQTLVLTVCLVPLISLVIGPFVARWF